jgi:hypothetical protein
MINGKKSHYDLRKFSLQVGDKVKFDEMRSVHNLLILEPGIVDVTEEGGTFSILGLSEGETSCWFLGDELDIRIVFFVTGEK